MHISFVPLPLDSMSYELDEVSVRSVNILKNQLRSASNCRYNRPTVYPETAYIFSAVRLERMCPNCGLQVFKALLDFQKWMRRRLCTRGCAGAYSNRHAARSPARFRPRTDSRDRVTR